MSGQYITAAAATFPHRIKAAASLYGVGIITDKEDSPHLQLDKVKGELYYAFAETDRSVPEHIPGELKGLLDKHAIKHELKVFPGTEHGFAFNERAVYNTLAAEEIALWGRTPVALRHPLSGRAAGTGRRTPAPALSPNTAVDAGGGPPAS
jgi:carboxymethylenebutenolidase